MSYVPKYILKRLIPQDAAKKVADGVELTIVNVISPIPVADLPGNPIDEIKVSLNDKELSEEQMKSIKFAIDDGEFVDFENLRSVGNIPVGAKIKIFLPTTEYNVGEEVTSKVVIAIVNMEIEATRTIQE